MGDSYLENPERLKGQPKRTLADYVERNGVLVPRRFDSLAEAKDSDLPIMVRSEHTQEYDGVSGLLRSEDLDEFSEITNEKELWNELLKEEKLKEEKGKTSFPSVYCAYNSLDVHTFFSEVSFSYWEKLGGVNRTVVADSSIARRYHIMSTGNEDTSVSYVILDNGEISPRSCMIEKNTVVLEEFRELVAIYEKVRTLNNFDANHCPIMEFQSFGGKHYFLQYHRTRDFQKADFQLEKEPEEDEVEALLVRGATTPAGSVCKITISYAEWELLKKYKEWQIPEREEGSFDFHNNLVFSEIMTRRRKLQVLETKALEGELMSIAVGHTRRSIFFKPEISVILQRKEQVYQLIPKEEWETSPKKARETGEDKQVLLRVISDGNKAYLKRMA